MCVCMCVSAHVCVCACVCCVCVRCVWECACAERYQVSSRAVAASETPSAARFRRSAEAPVTFM